MTDKTLKTSRAYKGYRYPLEFAPAKAWLRYARKAEMPLRTVYGGLAAAMPDRFRAWSRAH